MNKTGYVPHTFDDVLISTFNINNTYRTLEVETISGRKQAISLDLDHSDVPIVFVMHVAFNEDTAAAMALCDVAPIEASQVDASFHRKQFDLIRNEFGKAMRGRPNDNFSDLIRQRNNVQDTDKYWRGVSKDFLF